MGGTGGGGKRNETNRDVMPREMELLSQSWESHSEVSASENHIASPLNESKKNNSSMKG